MRRVLFLLILVTTGLLMAAGPVKKKSYSLPNNDGLHIYITPKTPAYIIDLVRSKGLGVAFTMKGENVQWIRKILPKIKNGRPLVFLGRESSALLKSQLEEMVRFFDYNMTLVVVDGKRPDIPLNRILVIEKNKGEFILSDKRSSEKGKTLSVSDSRDTLLSGNVSEGLIFNKMGFGFVSLDKVDPHRFRGLGVRVIFWSSEEGLRKFVEKR